MSQKMRIGISGLLATAGSLIGTMASAQSAPATSSAVSNDEVRAIVAEMLSDADSRSSLLSPGAGHDGHFYIGSEDGNFRLDIDGMLQFRYMMNFRSDDNTIGNDDFQPGFQTQNTKLRFSGNVVNDKWLFNVESNFDHDGGGSTLEDAYVAYKLAPEWLALWGQVKAPVLREWMVDDRYQLAAGRSITEQAFNHGYSQAIALVNTAKDYQIYLVYSDGAASGNTDFTSPAESDWSFSGRFNWKIAGDWAAFDDFTSFRGSKFAAMLGAAIHYQGSPNSNNASDTDTKVLLYTVDAQLEGDGWNAFAAFIGRDIRLDTLASGTSLDDFGVVVQAGVFLTNEDEFFGRYDVVIPDSDRPGDPDAFNTGTIGWNHYFAKHAAKATVDVQYAFDSLASTAAVPTDNETGLLGDSKEGEVIVRLQFQLLF